MASWTAACPGLPGTLASTMQLTEGTDHRVLLPMFLKGFLGSQATISLGDILDDFGVDRDGDGRYDELIVKVEVTSSQAGDYPIGGWLQAGEISIRSNDRRVHLNQGTQTVEIVFDGQIIGDNLVDGPYQVEALWIARPDQPILSTVSCRRRCSTIKIMLIPPSHTRVSDFQDYCCFIWRKLYARRPGQQWKWSFDFINVYVPINIAIPGSFVVEGDLYDGQGNFVGHETWAGSDSIASLQFNVANTQPPYSLEHLNLIASNWSNARLEICSCL